MFAAGGGLSHILVIQRDVWEALVTDQENYFFVDVQARGYYPNYAIKRLHKKGSISIDGGRG